MLFNKLQSRVWWLGDEYDDDDHEDDHEDDGVKLRMKI